MMAAVGQGQIDHHGIEALHAPQDNDDAEIVGRQQLILHLW